MRTDAELETTSLGLPGAQSEQAVSEGRSAAVEESTAIEWAGLSATDNAGSGGLGCLPGRLVYDADDGADLPRATGVQAVGVLAWTTDRRQGASLRVGGQQQDLHVLRWRESMNEGI